MELEFRPPLGEFEGVQKFLPVFTNEGLCHDFMNQIAASGASINLAVIMFESPSQLSTFVESIVPPVLNISLDPSGSGDELRGINISISGETSDGY